MVHIGQNIAKLRGLRRLTQKEMAAKLHLSQPDYSKVEQKADIDDEMLALIATILEVTPEAIKNFNEQAAVNIISSTLTLHDNASSFNNLPSFNFNMADKLLTVVEENKLLYERVITEKENIIQMQKEVIDMYKKLHHVS